MAVPAPDATADGRTGAGYVAVLYGGPQGLTTASRDFWMRTPTAVPNSSRAPRGRTPTRAR
jgi:hypothetical protein